MKNVLAYVGFANWIFNSHEQENISCKLKVMQSDGTYKSTVVNKVIKNDAWSGTIETEDTIYYQSFKETV